MLALHVALGLAVIVVCVASAVLGFVAYRRRGSGGAFVSHALVLAQTLLIAQAAIGLRKAHPILRRRRFFAGDAKHGGLSELGDILWFKPDASEMDEADWNSGFARSLMVFLNGDAIPELDAVGRRITDDNFLLLFNAQTDQI